jgi:hypothetical protein
VKRAAAAALAACLLLSAGPAALAADLRRVESVGVVPIASGSAKSPRNAAVRAGVARAVESVAVSLGPALPAPVPTPAEGAAAGAKPDPTALAPELASALGKDPLDYAASYRIVEDRGTRRSLYEKQSGAESEYVVVVEVQVDAGRIAERLRAAGWLAAPAGSGAPLRLVLEGVRDYRAYASVRRLLVERGGARGVSPVEFSRGRAVLSVEGAPPPEALLASLQAAAPPELRMVALETGPEALTLLVEWVGAPPAATPEEGAAGEAAADSNPRRAD